MLFFSFFLIQCSVFAGNLIIKSVPAGVTPVVTIPNDSVLIPEKRVQGAFDSDAGWSYRFGAKDQFVYIKSDSKPVFFKVFVGKDDLVNWDYKRNDTVGDDLSAVFNRKSLDYQQAFVFSNPLGKLRDLDSHQGAFLLGTSLSAQAKELWESFYEEAKKRKLEVPKEVTDLIQAELLFRFSVAPFSYAVREFEKGLSPGFDPLQGMDIAHLKSYSQIHQWSFRFFLNGLMLWKFGVIGVSKNFENEDQIDRQYFETIKSLTPMLSPVALSYVKVGLYRFLLKNYADQKSLLIKMIPVISINESAEIAAYLKGLAEIDSPKSLPTKIEKSGLGSIAPTLDMTNSKWKLVYFWASWCGPCKASFASLRKTAEQIDADKLEWVGVSIDSDQGNWDKLKNSEQLPGIQFRDDEKLISGFFQLTTIPRYVLIDPRGNIVSPQAPSPADGQLLKFLSGVIK